MEGLFHCKKAEFLSIKESHLVIVDENCDSLTLTILKKKKATSTGTKAIHTRAQVKNTGRSVSEKAQALFGKKTAGHSV